MIDNMTVYKKPFGLDRDPSITQLSDGTILVNFFRLDEKVSEMRLTLIRSSDEGNTWTAPYDVPLEKFSYRPSHE